MDVGELPPYGEPTDRKGVDMKRFLVMAVCSMISVLLLPTTAQAARGDRCHGPLTTIFGTDGPDSFATGFVGTNESDVMFAFAGDDDVLGVASQDHICGAAGNDQIAGGDEQRAGEDAFGDHLFGGSGNDRLEGEAGMDFAYGGDGDDVLTGGSGDDQLLGGDGADDLSDSQGVDVVFGRSGDDTIRLVGGSRADQAFGGRGLDTCIVDPEDVTEKCEVIQVVT